MLHLKTAGFLASGIPSMDFKLPARLEQEQASKQQPMTFLPTRPGTHASNPRLSFKPGGRRPRESKGLLRHLHHHSCHVERFGINRKWEKGSMYPSHAGTQRRENKPARKGKAGATQSRCPLTRWGTNIGSIIVDAWIHVVPTSTGG